MLLDQTSARWTVILPAGAFTRYLRILSKNLGVGLSAFLRMPRRFRRCEPPIIAGFFTSSTPFFEALVPVGTRLAVRLSVEASRLLCQAFRFRQHLFSRWLAFRSDAVAALRRPLRRGRESMCLFDEFGKGVGNVFLPTPACSRAAPFVTGSAPAEHGQNCACRPGAALQTRAGTPAGHRPRRHRSPSRRAPSACGMPRSCWG